MYLHMCIIWQRHRHTLTTYDDTHLVSKMKNKTQYQIRRKHVQKHMILTWEAHFLNKQFLAHALIAEKRTCFHVAHNPFQFRWRCQMKQKLLTCAIPAENHHSHSVVVLISSSCLKLPSQLFVRKITPTEFLAVYCRAPFFARKFFRNHLGIFWLRINAISNTPYGYKLSLLVRKVETITFIIKNWRHLYDFNWKSMGVTVLMKFSSR